MPLQDMENQCLIRLQAPGINAAGAPNFGTLSNPPFDKNTVDFAINQGYRRECSDLNEFELADQSITLSSVPGVYKYQISPTPTTLNAAPISLPHRIFYSPITSALQYTVDNAVSVSALVDFPFLLIKVPTVALGTQTTSIGGSSTQKIGWLTAAGDPNQASWQQSVGNLNVVMNVTAGNANLTVTKVEILRVDTTGNTLLFTIGSGTFTTLLTNPGYYNFPVSWTNLVLNASDRLMIRISVANANVGAQGFTWQVGIGATSFVATPLGGAQYQYEYKPGYDFISWDEFQKKSLQGYFQVIAASSTLPEWCTLSPNRQFLQFFSAPASLGDAITVQYAPLPSTTTAVPILAAATDAIIFPQDCEEAIVCWAMYQLMWRQREKAAALDQYQLYVQELARIKKAYNSAHRGDITKFDLWQTTTYPYPVPSGYP